MRAKTSLPVLLTILMLASPAGATTMYSYVGDVFHAVSGNYSTSDRITGSLTLADGFPTHNCLGRKISALASSPTASRMVIKR